MSGCSVKHTPELCLSFCIRYRLTISGSGTECFCSETSSTLSQISLYVLQAGWEHELWLQKKLTEQASD